MPPASLALFWHQHQPYYPDDVSGQTLFPWVRLHGVKDYIGMALHIKEVPEFRCTINLVPSLLDQILRYTERLGSDRHLDVSRMSADALSAEDAVFLIDSFYMANVECMIRPYPRYLELHAKRLPQTDRGEKAIRKFSTSDLRDLQVWFNLTWMHPLLFEEDSELAAFREKGRGWSEDEKLWLLDRQLETLRRVIPLHGELAAGGQVELTTTPFYHPILPLLWDKRSAREAMPGCPLPAYLESYAEDVRVQIQRAVEFHTELFGAAPQGMWPSEGSVSHDLVEPIAQAGIRWIATDEEILSHSTDGFVSRDAAGHLRHPEMLYRPWHVDVGENALQVVFRDHGLSDLIGFHYQRNDPQAAANDLIGRVASIGNAVAPHNAGRPALVPIILDGENCWEYYPDGGVKFLRTLYRDAVSDKRIAPCRMIDHLQAFPAADRISRLFAGSWISHNFAIWIGHEEDRTAWDLLHETRRFLIEQTAAGGYSVKQVEAAWREIHIAEGSDWFWWFGDDHSSAQDLLFDQLFRKHLQNVYRLLEQAPPDTLLRPVTSVVRRVLHTTPRALLNVNIDGRETFFEWLNAGHYDPRNERGTMTRVSEGAISALRFGFDAERLCINLAARASGNQTLAELDAILVRFHQPDDVTATIELPRDAAPVIVVRRGREIAPAGSGQVAAADVLELAISRSVLGVAENDHIRFSLELIRNGQSVDRAPAEGEIELTVPHANFDLQMWQA